MLVLKILTLLVATVVGVRLCVRVWRTRYRRPPLTPPVGMVPGPGDAGADVGGGP